MGDHNHGDDDASRMSLGDMAPESVLDRIRIVNTDQNPKSGNNAVWKKCLDTVRFLRLLEILANQSKNVLKHNVVPTCDDRSLATKNNCLQQVNNDSDSSNMAFDGIALHSIAKLYSLDKIESSALNTAVFLFEWDKEIKITRAPGRLDVMGGIADYSGSLVLQKTIAEAAHVAIQTKSPGLQPHIENGPTLKIITLFSHSKDRKPVVDVKISDLYKLNNHPISYDEARQLLSQDPTMAWSGYVAGALVVLMHEYNVHPNEDISMFILSEVPEGKGVSSSAALEVASLKALACTFGLHIDGHRLASLCQIVENLVVGAPCGIMDQMASSLGTETQLLALRCQPAELLFPLDIPSQICFWGIESGMQHSVGGSGYSAVRAGAFMGLKIASLLAHRESQEGSISARELDCPKDILGRGYLANIPVSEFKKKYESQIPSSIVGNVFLDKYGLHIDEPITSVDEKTEYDILKPTAHPVYENFRIECFRQVLLAALSKNILEGNISRQELHELKQDQIKILGELMFQSHESYNDCGLGSDVTDKLVELVKQERSLMEAKACFSGLYGAKITGGGCGGTVCVLGTADSLGEEAFSRVARHFAEETSYEPYVFKGGSAGAQEFGILRVVIRNSRNE